MVRVTHTHADTHICVRVRPCHGYFCGSVLSPSFAAAVKRSHRSVVQGALCHRSASSWPRLLPGKNSRPMGPGAPRPAGCLLKRLTCSGERDAEDRCYTGVTATCKKTNKYPISRDRDQQTNRQACASNYYPPPPLPSCKIGPSLSGTEAVWAYLHCSLTRLSLLRQNIKALCCFCREGARGLMRATFHSLPPPTGKTRTVGF